VKERKKLSPFLKKKGLRLGPKFISKRDHLQNLNNILKALTNKQEIDLLLRKIRGQRLEPHRRNQEDEAHLKNLNQSYLQMILSQMPVDHQENLQIRMIFRLVQITVSQKRFIKDLYLKRFKTSHKIDNKG